MTKIWELLKFESMFAMSSVGKAPFFKPKLISVPSFVVLVRTQQALLWWLHQNLNPFYPLYRGFLVLSLLRREERRDGEIWLCLRHKRGYEKGKEETDGGEIWYECIFLFFSSQTRWKGFLGARITMMNLWFFSC